MNAYTPIVEMGIYSIVSRLIPTLLSGFQTPAKPSWHSSMLARKITAALLVTIAIRDTSALVLRHPGILSVRFEHLFQASASALQPTMRVKSDIAMDEEEDIAVDEEQDMWVDDDLAYEPWEAADYDIGTMGDDEVGEEPYEDEADEDLPDDDEGDAMFDIYDYDEDDWLPGRVSKNTRKPRGGKFASYDDDDMDEDELAEIYIWR